jgi:hypothetical protein
MIDLYVFLTLLMLMNMIALMFVAWRARAENVAIRVGDVLLVKDAP